MHFSESTNSFYDQLIHGDNMPLDAVEITDKVYQSLLSDQSSGKVIVSDGSGNPITIDYVYSPDQINKQRIDAIEQEQKIRIDIIVQPIAKTLEQLVRKSVHLERIKLKRLLSESEDLLNDSIDDALDIINNIDDAAEDAISDDVTLVSDIVWPVF